MVALDRSATGRYDTLTSSLNGQQSYIDTTWREQYERNTALPDRIERFLHRAQTTRVIDLVCWGRRMVGTTMNASASVQHFVNTTATRSPGNYPELDPSYEADDTRKCMLLLRRGELDMPLPDGIFVLAIRVRSGALYTCSMKCALRFC